MSNTYKSTKKRRHKARKRILASFGHKCGICAYNKCSRALSLHHIDPESKSEELKKGKTRAVYVRFGWEKVVRELKKCVLVCANCHMEIEAGITQVPKDIKRFDESYTDWPWG